MSAEFRQMAREDFDPDPIRHEPALERLLTE
jgi:hypothetical protein